MNKNVLVRAPNWIGDQILAYPFFHYLRQTHPESKITSLCVPWVESVQFRNLVDEVIVLPRVVTGKPNLCNRAKFLEKISKEMKKKGPWDASYCLPNSFSSAWIFYRIGVKKRIGYRTDARGFFLTDKLEWKNNLHRAQAYVNLLSDKHANVRDFWGIPPTNSLDPGTSGVLKEFDAEKAWPSSSLSHSYEEPPNGSYWVMAPGSTAESRRWSPDQFAALARKIAQELGMPGLIVGGPAEAPIASRIKEIAGKGARLFDYTARGSVSGLWKIFRYAKFAVTNDSGLAHVAALCGALTYIVWGGGDPKETEPLGPGKVRVLFNPVECWPCRSNSCIVGNDRKLECLKGIDPESVWKEIELGLQS